MKNVSIIRTLVKSAAALFALAVIVLLPSVAKADNPIVQTYYTGDPAPFVSSDGVFYCYSGHDEDVTEKNFYTMKDWRAYSSTDMVNWKDQGTVLKLSDFEWANQDDARAWAGQVCERNGKFYFYICAVMKTGGYFGIGVAVADSPAGPFKDAIGEPLIRGGVPDIDPTVYIDDDGQAYLYYSQNPIKYVLLNEDMVSYDKSVGKDGIVSYDTAEFGLEGYVEGPWLYARKNDSGEKIYYMIYAGSAKSGGSEDIRYATSSSPTGPWEYGDVIMKPQSIAAVDDGGGHGSFTIHPGIVDYKGHSYFVYHNAALPDGSGYHRSVAIEEFTYGADGSIPLIPMTLNDRQAVDVLNPYNKTEAETICWEYGVKTEDYINDSGAIEVNVYNMHNDDYIKLENVDFGSNGAESFTAAVKNVKADAAASIELYIKDNDSAPEVNKLELDDAEKIGTLKIENASDTIKELTTKLDTRVTGVHDLYLVFRGTYEKPEAEQSPDAVISEEDTGMFHFDYWKFTEVKLASPTPSPTPVPTQSASPAPTQPAAQGSATPVPAGDKVTTPKVAKVVIKSFKNVKGKKAKLVVKKAANAKSYKVIIAANKKLTKGKRVITIKKGNSVVINKLKKGKTYYVRVYGIGRDSSGKSVTGPASKIKSVKIKR